MLIIAGFIVGLIALVLGLDWLAAREQKAAKAEGRPVSRLVPKRYREQDYAEERTHAATSRAASQSGNEGL